MQNKGYISGNYYSTYFESLPWALSENNAWRTTDVKLVFVEWMSGFDELSC